MSSMYLSNLMQATADAASAARGYNLGLREIFLLFFIMLGPVKILGPFFMATHGLDTGARRGLSVKVFAGSLVVVIVAGVIGSGMMVKWHVAPAVMMLASGLVFLLAALQMVLSAYRVAQAAPVEVPAQPAVHRLVYPVTVTPYGVAAVITLMALSQDMRHSLTVLGLALAVLVINLVAMLLVRWLMRGVGPMALQVVGAVLGILQVALALQLMVVAWRVLFAPGMP